MLLASVVLSLGISFSQVSLSFRVNSSLLLIRTPRFVKFSNALKKVVENSQTMTVLFSVTLNNPAVVEL